jgi:L-histidine N-alpha-methyltransferase
LDADFRHDRMEFVARWNAEREWMEIGFRARRAHVVAVRALDVSLALADGEQLRFEISAKFRRRAIEDELAAAGLRLEAWWTEAAGDFGVALAEPG